MKNVIMMVVIVVAVALTKKCVPNAFALEILLALKLPMLWLEMDSVTMRLTTYFATLMALTVAPILAAHAMVSLKIKVSNSYNY